MTSSISRRHLLSGTAAAGLGIAITGNVAAVAGTRASEGYGELVDDPDGLLSLPAGFSYTLVARTGVTTTTDGAKTASDPDGTGVFALGGGWALVNNHEIGRTIAQPPGPEAFGVPPLAGLTYDPGNRGGTSTIEVDADGNRIAEYVSLAGTSTNCAGGKSPWGTWLTCEETEDRSGRVRQKDHGYVFEVDPSSQAANVGKSPVPLKFLGRFAHEAVSIDPETTVIYETEDADEPNGLFYRWVPPEGFAPGKDALRTLALDSGGDTAGRLQAMSCYRGSTHVPDLSAATTPGTRYTVQWIDVPDRDAATVSLRSQFTDDQVTRGRKLEGTWWGDGGAYFVSSFARTSDGSLHEHDGQIWLYDPATEIGHAADHLRRQPRPRRRLRQLRRTRQHHRVAVRRGDHRRERPGHPAPGRASPTRARPIRIARNDLNESEFTGPCFSDDGKILFACIQSPGHVFAITGPWRRPSNADT